jgi:hypothetical protein
MNISGKKLTEKTMVGTVVTVPYFGEIKIINYM